MSRFRDLATWLGVALALAAAPAARAHGLGDAAPAELELRPPVAGLSATRTPGGDVRLVNHGSARVDVTTPAGAAVTLHPVPGAAAPGATLPADATPLTASVAGRRVLVQVVAPRRASPAVTAIVFLAVPLLALAAAAVALARAKRPSPVRS